MSNWDPVKESCQPIEKPVAVTLVGGTQLWMSQKNYKALVKVLKETYHWNGEEWIGDSPLVSVIEPTQDYKPKDS